MTHITDHQAQALQQAFNLFNATSTQLSDSYSYLERRVAELSERLAVSNDARLNELAQRQRIANRLQALIEALPGAVIAINNGGIIEECNAKARSLLGDPLCGLPWSEVSLRAFHKACSDAGELHLDDDRYISVSTQTLADGGSIFLFTDVTESRRQQARLGHYQRLSALGDMSARLAHQLRTPLAAAVLYISQLVDGTPTSATAMRISNKALERLKHLERLINGMLTYARGEQRASTTHVTIAALLDEVKQAIDPECQKTNICIAVPNADVAVRGQPELLSAALLNLVHNACKAIADNGQVNVSAEVTTSHVHIFVSDTGPGVPIDLKERIFEPFFTTRTDGTGLGLAIARSIFESYGGSLTLEPPPPQGGAIFHIQLPLADVSSALLSRSASYPTPLEPSMGYLP